MLAQVFPNKNRTVFRAKKRGGIVKRWAERGFFPFEKFKCALSNLNGVKVLLGYISEWGVLMTLY